MSREIVARSRKRRGRPAGDMTPKSGLAQRLQLLFGTENFSEIGEKIGVKKDAAIKYLRGEGNPPGADTIERIVRHTGCDPRWLILGEGIAYPREYVTHPRPGAPVTIPPHHRPQPTLIIPPDAEYVTQPADQPPLVPGTKHALFIADKAHRPSNGQLVTHIGNAPDKAVCYRIYASDDGYTLVAPHEQQPPRHIAPGDIQHYRLVLGLWFL